MCGIVGYIGDKQAQEVLINGLSRLEYRGYDSAGIATLENEMIRVEKKKGRLKNLEDVLDKTPLSGQVGIGHTRWATHGVPSDANAHPHCSVNKEISVVHNGIIENYMTLKDELQAQGHVFISDTDTEVIAHLLNELYTGDLVETIQIALQRMSGSYALAVLCANEPDKIVAVRKDSPLIVGLGDGENFIASDIPAILNYTREVYLLDNGEMAVLTADHIQVMNSTGNTVDKEVFVVDWDPGDAEKGGYDHFMMKEMVEQPKAMMEALMSRCCENGASFAGLKLNAEMMKKINRIQIVACGTAYHAGMVGKYYFEKFARISVETEAASEYRYKNPIVDENTLLIVISQSGETADTLAAIRLAKERGAWVLAVTNVVGSSIAREADDVIYTNAGPEIAVASTKAYVTQVGCMMLLASFLGNLNGKMKKEDAARICHGLMMTPGLIDKALETQDVIKAFADKNYQISDLFYMGRGVDLYTSMEGSLKLKEISYIHSEAYAAGELKHGPIALIEDGTIVVAVCTQENVFEKMLSNIKEVKARGAHVLAIVQAGHEDIASEVDEVWVIPEMDDDITAIPTIVYLQLLAYYLAVARGCDVDKPKNLAKSVTVE
ncbi:glutamine--fructose-6-phosphate transaminase (isomerizing) [Acetobacterium wieringae]|uniref:Glutamine--fructose-6-phosphate aminotransferase [isomerizing] n=1 Tax=Acetobacterium wieringae TaxID=52694 RepID=A0ABY6HHD1_9FIRM|nr:glutamine--fructose-6-phosphate transaminase (isomerizing) [Acetobacterium wieringae]UYO63914.1 glutamine--fructose-6-phosphate transaminase (isomerizing) [Acetobacterium wieringae]VUZ27908.1 Glutamine--fructose-6-phosphate aminotransferase [isomerizing] [Acetobacterium wieringae]